MKPFDSPNTEKDAAREEELGVQEDAPSPCYSPPTDGMGRENPEEEDRDEGGPVFVDMTEKYRGMGFIIGLGPPWPTCPLCGFFDVKKVFYGAADELPDPADYIHAGEEVLDREGSIDPGWHCPDCGHSWGEESS